MFITSLFCVEDLVEMKESGVDTVVVGGTSFSVGATLKLELNDLRECVKKVHELMMGVYVLCNAMVFDEDIELLRDYLLELKEMGVDGIYYADVSVYMIAKEIAVIDKLIFAPGFILVNTPDIELYLKQGIQQVELSNELTLEEKIEISKSFENQIQMVVHGYLMMSYSRRELLSNYFDEVGIGLEVKDCLAYYLVEETRENPMPIMEVEKGTLIYSPYILESFDEIKRLHESGVNHFRIEGLFLDKESVIDLIKAYQSILAGMDAEKVKRDFKEKYPFVYQESGFYYQKTNMVK